MEIQTVWGVNWRVASAQEVLIALLIILIIILLFLVVYIYLRSNKDVSHEYQYILFKAKSKGLTNFQYKILRGMTEMLKLKHPSVIVSSPELYEKSIGTFIHFLTSKEEEEVSLLKIFKDIVITYEKMYKDIKHKKPLETIDQLQTGHLIYFYTDELHIYLGKIESFTPKLIGIQLFRKPSDIRVFPYDQPVRCFFWRPGDAEYYFDSQLIESKNNVFYIARPESFNRGSEVRLPYINVIVPCRLQFEKDGEQQEIQLTIYKLGEHELIIRSTKELGYSKEYTIVFDLSEFTITSPVILISDKTVSDKGIYYYTFKIVEMSEPARQVVRSYIYEHL